MNVYAEKERLGIELTKVNETLTNLDVTVILEHEEGFNKAMRQAAFLLKVDLVVVGFDLYQDVYGGEMRSVEANLSCDPVGEGGIGGEKVKAYAGPSGGA